MKIRDLFEETYSAVIINKVRSGLTILGIVIGIGSVIAMVALGAGAQSSIAANIQSIGSNLLTVSPGAARGRGEQVSSGRGSAQTLTLDDAVALKAIAQVKAVAPQTSGRYQLKAKAKNTNTNVLGTIAEYASIRNVELSLGSFITEQTTKSSNKVAVLGATVRDDLFGLGADPVGQSIRVNNQDFKVIGVTRPKGGTGFNNQDDVVYIPLTTAQRFLTGNNFLSAISIQAADQQAMTAVQEEITSLLLSRHSISDPLRADFNVFNQADLATAATSVTDTFTILLASIAGISLLVGGIGIMNMMLTNVTERTREIGLRKAIGGKKRDISAQFLMEAVVLTFFGGAAGIVLGWFLSWGVSKFAGIATHISISSVLLAFGVSAGIGLLFGYYPARRAAKLNPIEALRYE